MPVSPKFIVREKDGRLTRVERSEPADARVAEANRVFETLSVEMERLANSQRETLAEITIPAMRRAACSG